MRRTWCLTMGSLLVCAAPLFAQPQIAVNGVLPPELANAAAGSTVAVSITGSPGNPTDWLGLYAAGSGDGSYVSWRYF